MFVNREQSYLISLRSLECNTAHGRPYSADVWTTHNKKFVVTTARTHRGGYIPEVVYYYIVPSAPGARPMRPRLPPPRGVLPHFCILLVLNADESYTQQSHI
ncbi:hypothetical protein KGM_200550 [Danaus plexippus plexippus]|uniref:Uncharacterized protein n=1 Tax=Danaus plexippus plexippus TaxID=278856 RepID=A0A212FCJ7_DANPL|nr:hypothetical protein KGM_200550 [Danaus plexippus plexippus]